MLETDVAWGIDSKCLLRWNMSHVMTKIDFRISDNFRHKFTVEAYFGYTSEVDGLYYLCSENKSAVHVARLPRT